MRAATLYIDLDQVIIVIVGDGARIEWRLSATNIAPTVFVEIDGRTVKPRQPIEVPRDSAEYQP